MTVQQVKIYPHLPEETFNRAVAAASMSGLAVQAADSIRNRMLATSGVSFPSLGDTLYAEVSPMGSSTQVRVQVRPAFIGLRRSAEIADQFLGHLDMMLARSGATYEGGSLQPLAGQLHPNNPSPGPLVVLGLVCGFVTLLLGVLLVPAPGFLWQGWYLIVMSLLPFLGSGLVAGRRFNGGGSILALGGLFTLFVGIGFVALLAGLRARSYNDWLASSAPGGGPFPPM